MGVVRGGEGFLDHLVRLVDAALDRCVDDGLAGEALLAADVDVYREDHGVSGGNDGRVQRVDAGGTLGFHLQVDADFLGRSHEGIGRHVGVGDARGAGRDGDEPLGAPVGGTGARRGGLGDGAANAVRHARPACRPGRRPPGRRCPACVVAARRAAVKSFLISERASLDSSFRCSWSAPSGAAMKKMRSAGPSLAPKSTGCESRAMARVGSVTAAERQCGMAMPPGTPVAVFCSRAKASAKRPSTSDARPVGGNLAGQEADDVLGRIAQVLVERDQFGGDELSHCQSFRRAVMVTASGVVWWTAGTVEPGREAAAAPCATA